MKGKKPKYEIFRTLNTKIVKVSWMVNPWILSILRYFSVSPLTPNYSGDLGIFLSKKKWLLTDAEHRLVYFSYFYSIISYGILLWCNTADIQSIFVLQKRAIHAIYNLGHKDSLRQKFKEIHMLSLDRQRVKCSDTPVPHFPLNFQNSPPRLVLLLERRNENIK